MSTPENPYRRQPKAEEIKIDLDGREFEFVIMQRDGKSSIYKSGDAYMRIGDSVKVHANLELHKKLQSDGFPVAKLLGEGEKDGKAYFMESSLGDDHLGSLFAKSSEQNSVIGEEVFEQFLTIAEKFALAQLSTRDATKDYNAFGEGVLLSDIKQELPDQAEKLQSRFDEVQLHTEGLPFVLTHGDFNPNNLYPDGVIDFEDSFHAPYGYDLVSAITHINYFSDSTDQEFYARYRFTPVQKQQYFERLDAVSVEAGLPPLSEFEEDFEFCRAIWLAARLPHVPKLKKFRYDMLRDKFL